jgi:hypothetical protein
MWQKVVIYKYLHILGTNYASKMQQKKVSHTTNPKSTKKCEENIQCAAILDFFGTNYMSKDALESWLQSSENRVSISCKLTNTDEIES